MKLLSTAEASRASNLSQPTLQRYRVQGGGPPFVKLGPRRIAYDLDDLEAWVQSRKYAHRAATLAGNIAK